MSYVDSETICEQIRKNRKEGVKYKELNDEFDLSLDKIIRCVIGESEEYTSSEEEAIDARDDEPWKEEFVIKELYIKMDMRFTEMSKCMDCHSETAKKYVDEFEVSPVKSSDRTSSPRVNKLQRLGAETNGDIEIK